MAHIYVYRVNKANGMWRAYIYIPQDFLEELQNIYPSVSGHELPCKKLYLVSYQVACCLKHHH